MKVNYRAPCNILGMGIFGLIYYKYMKELGYDVRWKLISKERNFSEEMKLCYWFNVDSNELAKDTTQSFHEDVPIFTMWHPHDLLTDTDGLPVKSAVVHFESSGFLPEEIDVMSQVNHISSCSTWGNSILTSVLVDRPPVLWTAPWIYPSLECRDILRDNLLTFKESTTAIKKHYDYDVIMFSGGKWEKRKQQFRFLNGSLTSSKKVLITGLWSNPFLGGMAEPEKALKVNGFKLKNRMKIGYNVSLDRWIGPENIDIALCGYVDDFSMLQALVKAHDAYLSISAGEGLDQPLIEAMGLGIPCLATKNTAHTSYLGAGYNLDLCYKIECTEELADDGIWFKGNKGNWYPPKEDCLQRGFDLLIENITTNLTKIGGKAQTYIKELHSSSREYFDDFINGTYFTDESE